VARWLKKAGEAVAADEALVELETDEVTVPRVQRALPPRV
jgi:2-oxoglutarate dehydrogenase E2 component (dihydrolipoamide succinyltransferase)